MTAIANGIPLLNRWLHSYRYAMVFSDYARLYPHICAPVKIRQIMVYADSIGAD